MSTCLGCGRAAAHLSRRIGHPMCAKASCHQRLHAALDELAPHPTDGGSVLVRHDSPLAPVCAHMTATLLPDTSMAHSATHMAVPRQIGEAVALIGVKHLLDGQEVDDEGDTQQAKRQATTSPSSGASSLSAAASTSTPASAASLAATSSLSTAAAPAPAPPSSAVAASSLFDALGERALVQMIIERGDARTALAMMHVGARTRAIALEPGRGLEVALAKSTRSECVSICAEAIEWRDTDEVLACQRAATAWFDESVVPDAIVARIVAEYKIRPSSWDVVPNDDWALLYWLFVSADGPGLHVERHFPDDRELVLLLRGSPYLPLFDIDYLRMARYARLPNGALPWLAPSTSYYWARELCRANIFDMIVYHTERASLLYLLGAMSSRDPDYKEIVTDMVSVMRSHNLEVHLRYLCPVARTMTTTEQERNDVINRTMEQLVPSLHPGPMLRWLAELIVPKANEHPVPAPLDSDTAALYDITWAIANDSTFSAIDRVNYKMLLRMNPWKYATHYAVDKLLYDEWQRLQPMYAVSPEHAGVVMSVKLRALLGDRAVFVTYLMSRDITSRLGSVRLTHAALSVNNEVDAIPRLLHTPEAFGAAVQFTRNGAPDAPGDGLAMFENGGAVLAAFSARQLQLRLTNAVPAFSYPLAVNSRLVNVADAARFLVRCLRMPGLRLRDMDGTPANVVPRQRDSEEPRRVGEAFMYIQSLLYKLPAVMPVTASTDPAWAVVWRVLRTLQQLVSDHVAFSAHRDTNVSADELIAIEHQWLDQLAPDLIAAALHTPLQHLTRGQQIDKLIAELADEAAALEEQLGLPPSRVAAPPLEPPAPPAPAEQ